MKKTETFIVSHLSYLILSLCVSATNLNAQPFDLSHNVIAGGGESNSTGSAGGRTFNVSGTIGQGVAGVSSNSSPARFALHGGFWFQNLAPTAAAVAIMGRVTTANGHGIRKARLVLTSLDGARRTTITSTFGYYAFDGVEAGNTYLLEIFTKKFTFANPTRVFLLQDTVADMDFVAQPE